MLKAAPPAVAMPASSDDDTRGAAASGAREPAPRFDSGARARRPGLRTAGPRREPRAWRLASPAKPPTGPGIGVVDGCYDRQEVSHTHLTAGTRKLVAATAVGVALAVALAGCGGGNGGKAHHSSTSSTSTSKGSKKKPSSAPGY